MAMAGDQVQSLQPSEMSAGFDIDLPLHLEALY